MTTAVFGQYRLDRVIATGGMGVVYEAYDTATARTVALKCLPVAWSDDEGFRQRFLQEISITAQLTEPHVIPVHHWGEIDGRLYLDMRKVDGLDLARMLRQQAKPLDPERAVHIIEQVASALDAAHAAGLVHRDVKPANMLIVGQSAQRDFAYLIDFGIANALSQSTSLTAAGQVVGTASYMAPERWRLGLPGYEIEDHRVDVYALGCVLYELIDGHCPFRGLTRDAIAEAHLHNPVPPLESLPGGVGERLSEVLRRALAKSPTDRFSSAGEFAAAALAAVSESSTPLPRATTGAPLDAVAPVKANPVRPSSETDLAAAPSPTPSLSRMRSRRPPRRVPVILGSLVLAAASVVGITLTTSALSQPPSVAPAARPDTLNWAEQPPFITTGKTLFEQSLASSAPEWSTGRTSAADIGFRDGAYVVQPLDKRHAVYVEAPAPTKTYVSDSVVTATATLQGGQGIWGVWCRGVDKGPSNAYLFLISHTAAVQITRTGFTDGTGWKHLDGIDVTQPVTISARCADVQDAPVELTMAVNGRQVLSYPPTQVLSPGHSGITVQPFGDVDGPIAAAAFSDFRISSPG